MKVNLNSGVTNIEIPYGEIMVVLVLKNTTSEEFCQFLKARFKLDKRAEVIEDQSSSARINFIDKLLVDIKVKDKAGNFAELVFTDPASGAEKPLTPETPNWKQYVLPSFKYAAATVFEGVKARMENAILKN